MTRGERVIAFVERYCLVPEGKWVGQPMRLEDFQKRFIVEVYDNPAGTSRGILSIARKNGKTGLIAALVLAHLVGPEAVENSQIISGARSREQAGLVHGLASKMVQMSPDLSRIVRVVPSGKRLIGLPLNVEYRAISAEAGTAHGLSPILAILDELGQVKGPQDDFVDAVVSAQGAYDDGLQLVISTQAPTDADLLSVWIDDARRSDDRHTVCHVYEAEADCELLDREAWAAANPALGSFRSLKELERRAEEAERMPSAEAAFRNLNLNQRVNMFAPFVSPSVWKAGNGEPGELAGVVWGGLDLSATTDLTAFVLVGEREGQLCVWPSFWMPARNVRDATLRDRAPYDIWVKQGLLRTTPGSVIDYDHVANDIAQICASLDVQSIAFDRWRMDRVKGALERIGCTLNLEPWGQGYRDMTPALDALEGALLDERVRHGGHPVLAMCAANAVEIKDPAGNRKLDKAKATGRIDGMQALAMAMGVRARQSPQQRAATPWDMDPNFRLEV